LLIDQQELRSTAEPRSRRSKSQEESSFHG
jgi:hypothetical protein